MIKVGIIDLGVMRQADQRAKWLSESFGSVIENSLRGIITGQSSEALRPASSLVSESDRHKPSPSQIEADLKPLRSALVVSNSGRKALVPIRGKKQREAILRKRINRIGYTKTTLQFKGWAEARYGQKKILRFRKHRLEISTTGNNPTAIFRSRQAGLITFERKHRLGRKVVNDNRSLITQAVVENIRRNLP